MSLAGGSCADEDDPACIVGGSSTFAVTVGDVEVLRGHLRPAPAAKEARRLALDVATAHAIVGGNPDDPAEEKLRSYRRWLTNMSQGASGRAKAESAAAAMRSARAELGVEPGPCHPGPAPSLAEIR